MNFKYFVVLLILSLAAISAAGKPKPQPIYDQVGTLHLERFADSTYRYHGLDGSSYDSYCNTDINGDVSCAEGSGSMWVIERPGKPNIGLSLSRGNIVFSPTEGQEVHFRVASSDREFGGRKVSYQVQVVCIALDILDRHGKVKGHGEACYE